MSVVKPDAGRTLLFTESGFVWSFPAENYITLGIRGLIVGLATLGDALLAFSLEEVWAITGNDPASFVARRVDGATPGAFSQEAIVEWAGAVYYVGFDGLYRIDASYNVTRVSDAIRDKFLALTTASSVAGCVDRSRGILYWSLAGTLYSFDPGTGAWGSTGITGVTSLASGLSAMVGNGTTVSFLNDTVTEQTASFTTEFLDLGRPDVTKQFRRVSIAFENPGSAQVVALTPVKADGVEGSFLTSQTVPTGRSVLTWNLPVGALVGRGIALTFATTAPAGFTVVPPIEIEWRPMPGRPR